MDMKIKDKDNITVVHLKGKLFGGDFTEELNKTINKILDEGKKNLIFDLKGLTILNSSGFGILVASYTTVKKKGGDLKFARIPGRIKDLFSVTKLNKVFKQYSTIKEAVMSCK